ncbi:MAG: Gfo/Idh/MocA family oxidoreductase [Clostridia bacterium]|nr:Gfo/Idh/MocA family oxidoreductase [Clostridia bacterium]
MHEIRWAIVGTGHIANRFAAGMREVKDAKLAAVVSRREETGRAFADAYGAQAVYTDFAEMLGRAKPDVVYIGIPNDLHYDCIHRALDSGVNVLSEKPMVDTVAQLDEVCAKARSKGLFLMEGMWTRCFPAVRKVRQWIREGRIGDVLTVNVSFDIQPDYDDWQPWKAGIAHSGGALRDVGIYSLGVANLAFPGAPVAVYSTMHFNGEVDDACRLLLDYGDGRTAYAAGAFNQIGDHTARIVGTKGSLSFGPAFWCPSVAELRADGVVERFEAPYAATGFQFEIMAVQDALRAGAPECADFTHAESRVIAQIIEDARKSWGIAYRADEQ